MSMAILAFVATKGATERCMNPATVFSCFPDLESCIASPEKILWVGETPCLYRKSDPDVCENDAGRMGSWNCHAYKSAFSLLSGTVFERIRIALPRRFPGVTIMIDAKNSMSNFRLASGLDTNQRSACNMQLFFRGLGGRPGRPRAPLKLVEPVLVSGTNWTRSVMAGV